VLQDPALDQNWDKFAELSLQEEGVKVWISEQPREGGAGLSPAGAQPKPEHSQP